MKAALLIDFGSTYTKLRAVDVDRATILGSGQGPSTVTTDVTLGMRAALADLERQLGALPPFAWRLACSSAAGGLRMVTVGLVRELTAEAARQAALGAGARLVGTFAYRLTAADVARIEALAPDILLLAGGTDGGNSEVILHNAAALGASRLACPLVLAGNRGAMDECRERVCRTAGDRHRERHARIQRAQHRAGPRRDPRGVHRPHRARQGHRPRAGDVRPGADAHAGGGDGRRAPARRRLSRDGRSGRAARRRSRRRHHRRALGRLGRAQPAGGDPARTARAAGEAHRRGRPRHAPQHRRDRRKRPAPRPSPPTAASRRRGCAS